MAEASKKIYQKYRAIHDAIHALENLRQHCNPYTIYALKSDVLNRLYYSNDIDMADLVLLAEKYTSINQALIVYEETLDKIWNEETQKLKKDLRFLLIHIISLYTPIDDTLLREMPDNFRENVHENIDLIMEQVQSLEGAKRWLTILQKWV